MFTHLEFLNIYYLYLQNKLQIKQVMLPIINEADISDFINSSSTGILIDFRSREIYELGHLPNSINIPACTIGFEIDEIKTQAEKGALISHIGGRFSDIANQISNPDQLPLFIYDDGDQLISFVLASLFQVVGVDVTILKGGYHSFRLYLKRFLQGYFWNFVIVGGPLGSGKRGILENLYLQGEQVLDLEGIAKKLSPEAFFSDVWQACTPEKFENELLWTLVSLNSKKIIWVKYDQPVLSDHALPQLFRNYLNDCPIIYFSRPFQERLDNIILEYSEKDKSVLHDSILKISRRLGVRRTQEALKLIDNNDINSLSELLLSCFDQLYNYWFKQRESDKVLLEIEDNDPNKAVNMLIDFAKDNLRTL